MFHRVKSETTPESKTKLQDLVEEQKMQAAAEAESEELDLEDAQEDSAEASEETETETQNQEPQAKEIETMNTKEDTPAGEMSRPSMPTGSYGRSTQSAVRPGGYPGAYPGVAYGASAQAADQVEPTDRTLTIGAGITMSGEIESCDNLIVEGTVEAALKGARNLDIAESGTFYGTVEIEQAVIAGRFEGELNVSGRLVLRAGGIVTGSIAYGELEIEAGAIIDGRLTPIAAMQQAETAQPAAPKAKAPAAPKAKVSKKEEQPEAANSEGALFAAQA